MGGSRRRYNAGFAVAGVAATCTPSSRSSRRAKGCYAFRFRDPLDARLVCAGCDPSARGSSDRNRHGRAGDIPADEDVFLRRRQSGAHDQKPVSGTVRVAVAGVEKTLGTDFTVDTATGVVTFLAGHLPASARR